MENDQPEAEEIDARVLEFWTMTKGYADVGDLDVVLGRHWSEAVPPPAWSYGESADIADEFVELVLSGLRTATTSLHEEYSDDGQIAKAGDYSILLDGSGTPQALIRVTEVQVVPIGELTLDQVLAEDDDADLPTWRQAHQADWERAGYEVDDTSLVVWEQFQVLYPM